MEQLANSVEKLIFVNVKLERPCQTTDKKL